MPITIEPLLALRPGRLERRRPDAGHRRQPDQVNYTVTNLGTGPTDLSSWTDGIWLDTDKTKSRTSPARC